MSRSIYFINPAADFPTYFAAENYVARGFGRATQMADLTIPTLAAFCPPDLGVRLCDENLDDIDFAADVDYVGITGKITQFEHMVAIATEFRKRGKTVLIGGPYASLSPEMLRPHCDILVRGEIEEIAEGLFADLSAGTWQAEYVGTKPGLERSPLPRWELYPNDRAVMGTLQTSRGCPFECEFCDVIQYAGRKQRHKDVGQVLCELDVLYRLGYRNVFLADDNFTVYRSRAKELLVALQSWNQRQTEGKMAFLTQVSVDAAKDDELLKLCADAGLVTVFIGIETPNEASLRETKKRQNLRVDLVESVHHFLRHGIQVVGGMVVGFDADGPDIFQRQLDFAMASGIPIFSVGALVAPAATPLHARLKASGRLRENRAEVAAVPWTTNIIHPRFSAEAMTTGMKWLANHLYDPELFGERILSFIDLVGQRRYGGRIDPMRAGSMRSVDRDSLGVLMQLRDLGEREKRMWDLVTKALARKPYAAAPAFAAMIQYMQIRYMYDLGRFWEPNVVAGGSTPEDAGSNEVVPLRRSPAQATRLA